MPTPPISPTAYRAGAQRAYTHETKSAPPQAVTVTTQEQDLTVHLASEPAQAAPGRTYQALSDELFNIATAVAGLGAPSGVSQLPWALKTWIDEVATRASAEDRDALYGELLLALQKLSADCQLLVLDVQCHLMVRLGNLSGMRAEAAPDAAALPAAHTTAHVRASVLRILEVAAARPHIAFGKIRLLAAGVLSVALDESTSEKLDYLRLALLAIEPMWPKSIPFREIVEKAQAAADLRDADPKREKPEKMFDALRLMDLAQCLELDANEARKYCTLIQRLLDLAPHMLAGQPALAEHLSSRAKWLETNGFTEAANVLADAVGKVFANNRPRERPAAAVPQPPSLEMLGSAILSNALQPGREVTDEQLAKCLASVEAALSTVSGSGTAQSHQRALTHFALTLMTVPPEGSWSTLADLILQDTRLAPARKEAQAVVSLRWRTDDLPHLFNSMTLDDFAFGDLSGAQYVQRMFGGMLADIDKCPSMRDELRTGLFGALDRVDEPKRAGLRLLLEAADAPPVRRDIAARIAQLPADIAGAEDDVVEQAVTNIIGLIEEIGSGPTSDAELNELGHAVHGAGITADHALASAFTPEFSAKLKPRPAIALT